VLRERTLITIIFFRMKQAFNLILLVPILSCNLSSKEKISGFIDVFIIAGQSNARGVGDPAQSPYPSPGTVFQFDQDELQEVTDEVGNLPSDRGSAWPAFGITYYQQAGRKICFIPCAVDGSGQMPASDIGYGNWSSAGTLFRQSVNKTRKAIEELRARGFNPVLKGVLWIQGENDGHKINLKAITQSQYQDAFTGMISSYRNELGDSLLFYIFQIGTDIAVSDNGYSQVRAAQQAVCDANPSRNIMVSTRAITFPARGLMKDAVHWNQAALNEQGEIAAVIASK
jgi:hypothetical protein